MGYNSLINRFTAGELDPRLLGEVDYEGYRKGARKLRNVLCIPQGAAQRRFGARFEHIISNVAGPITNRDEVREIGFEYLSTEIYWIILKSNGMGGIAVDIYLDDADGVSVLQQTIDPFGTYTTAQLRQIRWTEDVNKIIFWHEDKPPFLLQRIAANNWVAGTAIFTFYPVEDFSAVDNPTNNYGNNGTTFTPNATNATTLTASQAVFTSNHAGIPPNGGGFFTGNGGIFRIVSVNAGGTVATGYCTEDFHDTTAILGSESFLGERAWNDGSVIGGAPAGINRGYPRHGAFFQSRLVAGGSPASPGAAYASEVKDYINFNNSDTDPSTGWGVEAGVTGTDKIQDILSSKSLILLTNKGSSATSILVETATTPLNVFLSTQGKEASRDMDAVILNNQVLYADRAGNTIWGMTYDVPDTGYTVSNASLISSHLIRNPRWADVFDPSNVDGRYYLLINDDGTMGIYNSILEENIRAWTLANTIGKFIDVGCISDRAKVLVQRQVGTGNVAAGLADTTYTVDSTFNVFRNITDSINGVQVTPVFSTDGDYLLIGNEIPFTQMVYSLTVGSAQNLNLTFEFLTNTGEWEFFTPILDGTLGFQQSGQIVWTIEQLSNWKSQIIGEADVINGDGLVYYWIRIRRTNSNTAFITPTVSDQFINTANRITFEALDFDLVMDATTTTTSNGAGLITGLTHLAGQNTFIFANGFPIGTYYVNASGEVEIDTLNAQVTIGLDFIPYIVPMPVVALLQTGYEVYDPKKIETLYIDFYESLGITVQGQNVPQVIPGEFMTDEIPVPTSDYYKVPMFAGWDPREPIIISQSYPAKMIIRGISFDVELS